MARLNSGVLNPADGQVYLERRREGKGASGKEQTDESKTNQAHVTHTEKAENNGQAYKTGGRLQQMVAG